MEEISFYSKNFSSGTEEKEILSNFSKLLFTECTDPNDELNHNDGNEADPFDKIAKYYGRNEKNIFLFIRMLRSADRLQSILNSLKDKCTNDDIANFLSLYKIYLGRICQGERNAEDFLNRTDFQSAFFSGTHIGPDRNMFENLSINFTRSFNSLDVSDIFNTKSNAMESENGKLKRLKIYDHDRRVVTVCEVEDGKRNYVIPFHTNCLIKLRFTANNESCVVTLNIEFKEICGAEFSVNGEKVDASKALNVSKEYSDFSLNGNSLYDSLASYFSQKLTHAELTKTECLPIKDLKHLKNWRFPEHKHVVEPLQHRLIDNALPRTLVCHDMKGGYLNDRFVGGVMCENEYSFTDWAMIDTFIYFSHHLITIPPCGWISAAHVNGVAMLGTFITEWDNGARICDYIFRDDDTVDLFVTQMTNIANYYGFDGWLINIENTLMEHQIPLLQRFINTLTQKMHASNNHSQILWYDSVTRTGELKWQNTLNAENRMFFEVCDGIFLNYNWTDETLETSMKEAGNRKSDVYVGVDVFGRGCPGGGGFSSNVAVQAARKHNLSVAIFAPGWIHECFMTEHFKQNQTRFWSLLKEYCESRTITNLPFCSSFCPGFGKKMFVEGKVRGDTLWFNLSLQQAQPVYHSNSQCCPENASISMYDEDAYSGGGCLKFSMKTYPDNNPNYVDIQFLKTCFPFCEVTEVSYHFKPLHRNIKLALVLVLDVAVPLKDQAISTKIVLMGPDEVTSGVKDKDGDTCEIYIPSLSSQNNDMDFAPDGKGTWKQRSYSSLFITSELLDAFNSVEATIKSVGFRIISEKNEDTTVEALLGDLRITCASNPISYDSVFIKKTKNDGMIFVSCNLSWNVNETANRTDLFYVNSEGEECFICRTSQNSHCMELEIEDSDSVQIVLYVECLAKATCTRRWIDIPLRRN